MALRRVITSTFLGRCDPRANLLNPSPKRLIMNKQTIRKLRQTVVEMLALAGLGALCIELPDLSLHWWSAIVAAGMFRVTVLWLAMGDDAVG